IMAMDRTSAGRKWSSMIDPLTGILNRRGFIECGVRMLRLTFINHQCAMLVEFDLNWLRSVKNAHGHVTADRVLCRFCDVVSRELRPCDLFGRIGDRQFACLIVDATQLDALVFAERIKGLIVKVSPDSLFPQHVTIRTGYAVANIRHSDLPTLMLEAGA